MRQSRFVFILVTVVLGFAAFLLSLFGNNLGKTLDKIKKPDIIQQWNL